MSASQKGVADFEPLVTQNACTPRYELANRSADKLQKIRDEPGSSAIALLLSERLEANSQTDPR